MSCIILAVGFARERQRLARRGTTFLPAIQVPIEKSEAVAELIERRDIRMVFQPIYALADGGIFAFEALTRFESSRLTGIVELMSVAARSAQLGDLGRLQRQLAVAHAPSERLSVNVHPAEFEYPLLVQPDDPIFQHRSPVYLEITESAPLSYFEQCTSVLRELRAKGVSLAVDDFGAGFSNIKYILDLDPEIVKIDRKLMVDVEHGTRQFTLLASIVALCHDMGARVVMEGVETESELYVAIRAGFDYCQGYLFSRPVEDAKNKEWPSWKETVDRLASEGPSAGAVEA